MFRKFALSTIAVALGAVLLVPLTAYAEGESTSRISGLEERLLALEDKLQASQETITAQRELLQVQTPAVSQGGLDAFLQSVSVGGYVEGSYTYNFKNPPAGSDTQLLQFSHPQNSFSFDAAKLELGRSTSGSGTAGFQLDLVWGANAGVLSDNNISATFVGTDSSVTTINSDGDLCDSFPTTCGTEGIASANVSTGSSSEVWVQQAYVSYDYEGLDIMLGRFETILGYEVIDTPDNANVTRGLLFTYAIPLWHQGLLLGGDIGEGLHWKAGLVNGANNAVASNDRKGILANVGMAQEGFGVDLNWYYGADRDNENSHMTQIYDLVMTLNPSDETSLWLNADWGTAQSPQGNGGHDTWKGVSIGVAQQMSDKLGIAVRGEWLEDKRNSRGLPTGRANFPLDPTVTLLPNTGLPSYELWSATVTANYALTDNLTARFEYRHDDVDADPSGRLLNDDGICTAGTNCANDRDIVLLDIAYVFD